MAPMSTVERLKVKNNLSRILRKKLSSSQKTVLQGLGIYYNGSGSVDFNFDECEDSVLWKLTKELQNLGSNSNGDEKVSADSVGKLDDHEEEDAKKSLRAAMLKSRFAETIWKANGGRSDEWEKLKTLKREEEKKTKKEFIMKQNLEKEEAKRRRQEQINKKRAAARMALELVEQNVVVVDNFKVMKEFEMLINGHAF